MSEGWLRYALQLLSAAGGAVALMFALLMFDSIQNVGNVTWATPLWIERTVIVLLAISVTALVVMFAMFAASLWLMVWKGEAL